MNHVSRFFTVVLPIQIAFLFIASSATASELSAKAPDVGHMMPLYEVAMIEKICSSDAYKTEIKKSRNECARTMFKVVSSCTADHQRKFPRGDNQKSGERLDYRSFAALYGQCLKDRHAVLIAAETVKNPK